ncbi:polyamine aminopropyltransferase [Methyloligella solikamskensis]|uniref:Polyamine aminopropyltransferase n=1 Tax=Methyloligella solikamskensis TaxID=1177756 RepID=A0ABW3JC70_9HYPH
MEEWVEETLHPGMRFGLKADRVLHDSKTDRQHLVIFEHGRLGKVMSLDGVVRLTTACAFVHHEMIAHLPLLAHGRAESMLIVGGGDGGALREALKHKSLQHVTLVETGQGLIDLSREHFPEVSAGAFDDPRAEVVISDIADFVLKTDRRFDVIVVDSTKPLAPEVYAGCKRVLNDGGIMVTRSGTPFLDGARLTESVKALHGLFRDASAYLAALPTGPGGATAYGWATDSLALRRLSRDVICTRFKEAGLQTLYYNPDIHIAAFALPGYVRALIEA